MNVLGDLFGALRDNLLAWPSGPCKGIIIRKLRLSVATKKV